MNSDKLKQYIGLFGGFLSAIPLFSGAFNIEFVWFNTESIGAIEGVLISDVPFALLIYRVTSQIFVGRSLFYLSS